MITKLKLKNFRGLSEVHTAFEPVTALLGPNSSGKTTLLHAIRVACSLLNYALSKGNIRAIRRANERIVIAREVVLSQHSPFLAVTDWRALFLDQKVENKPTSVIELTFSENSFVQTLQTKIRVGSNEQLKLTVEVGGPQIERELNGSRLSTETKERLHTLLQKRSPRAIFVPPFYGTTLDEEYGSRAAIRRQLGSGNQHHVVRNLVSSLSVERFKSLNAFLKDLLGATLTYRTSGDRLQTESPLVVRFQDTNGELEISAAGAGLVNLVALYSALSLWTQEDDERDLLFLLDEPEAHLSPRLQAKSTQRLSSLITEEFGSQLIFATHSVDILNTHASNGGLLLRIDRTATPCITRLESDATLFEDLDQWVDLTPYTAINFLASRRLLFCEGVTEVELLPRLGELLFMSHSAHRRRFNQWSIVQLQGVENAKTLPPLLARLLNSDAIAKSATEPFQIVVVLDKDYSREPKVDLGGELSQIIWPQHSVESLFCTPGVLNKWISACLPSDVDNLSEVITNAIEAANNCSELNEKAQADLFYQLFKQEPAPHANHGKTVKELPQRAREQVQQHPEIWQRGKDRLGFILKEVKGNLNPSVGGHLPTSLKKLVHQADLNAISPAKQAIPTSLFELLNHLVS